MAQDAERMARLEREAQVLASLNHPNIAAIYGLEEAGATRALALELVEGITLADRIARGPIPLDESVAIAKQIAEALEYAHEKGIVHRDLKPANVKITPDGTVKVLDFGLAKAAEAPAGATPDPTQSPTLTAASTQAGLIMGTAAYMSPEQASGRPVDKRSDIWSFGVVLWEMVSGQRLFAGETVSHTLADVLRAEVDPQKLPAGTPPRIRELLARCLDRGVKHRLRDIGEARIALEHFRREPPAATPPAPESLPPARRAGYLPWILAATATTLLAALAFVHFRESAPPVQPIQFQIRQPDRVAVRSWDIPVISPDGRNLVFTGLSDDGESMLWLRPLNSLEARPLPGTQDAYFPFWSPDSRSVAFFAASKLRRIDIAGGAPNSLCDISGTAMGGSWGRDGTIVFGNNAGPLLQVSSSGGIARPVRELDAARQENSQIWPRFLPDGKHLLYWSRSATSNARGIYVTRLGSKETKQLLNTEGKPDYAAPGYLLYAKDGSLLAQAFDADRLQLAGDPFPVAEGVGSITEVPGSLYSCSDTGTLVHRALGATGQRIAVVTPAPAGKSVIVVGETGIFRQIALSPDQKRVAIEKLDNTTRTWDIWLLELGSGIFSRFTVHPGNDSDPAWSPDSRELVFNSDRAGAFDLYRKALGFSQEELLFSSPEKKVPEAWSKDNSILFGDSTGSKYFRLLLGGERKAVPFVQVGFRVDEPHLSPDERWVAFGSNESGRWEVYVAAFPSVDAKRQVSNGGGGQPHWRGDGKELYYVTQEGKMMAVDVQTGSGIETGAPRLVFDTQMRTGPTLEQYAVMKDGTKFLLVEPVLERVSPITVMLNWTGRSTSNRE
jgi:serine/threonine protein kinase